MTQDDIIQNFINENIFQLTIFFLLLVILIIKKIIQTIADHFKIKKIYRYDFRKKQRQKHTKFYKRAEKGRKQAEKRIKAYNMIRNKENNFDNKPLSIEEAENLKYKKYIEKCWDEIK